MDVDEITSAPSPEATPEAKAEDEPKEATKVTYKSWKKKYRKMRVKFEEKMNESNTLFKNEQDAAETARRIALENDQLLDLLLDVNDSAQIPGHLRIDLDLDTPSVESLPSLIADLNSTEIKANTPLGQEMYDELRSLVDAKLPDKLANRPTKSLASLIATTPHHRFLESSASHDLTTLSGLSITAIEDLSFADSHTPVSYIEAAVLDDHLASIDTALHIPLAHTLQPYNPPVHLSDKELAVRNPNSVYNWLRRHEPKIFLQDGEGSEKSSGKPGALRGAGKRASIPAPTKPDMVEFVEEDGTGTGSGMGYDGAGGAVGGALQLGAGTLKGKRKRASEDDSGYRPKGGVSRPYKKKKKGEKEEGVGSRRSSKGKVKVEVETEGEEMAGLGQE